MDALRPQHHSSFWFADPQPKLKDVIFATCKEDTALQQEERVLTASGHLDKDGMGALPEPIDGNDGVAAAVPYRPAMVPSEAPLIASPARACRHLAVTRALARAPPGWLCPRAAVRAAPS